MAVAAVLTCPAASVVAVVVPSVARAPVVGAANVTVTPATGLPRLSVTVATSGFVNAAPTVADWPPPEVAVIAVAAPALLVSAKLAAVATPETEAVTL